MIFQFSKLNNSMTNRLVHPVWKNRATQSAWRAACWTLLGLMLLMALAGCANKPSSLGAAGATHASSAKNSSLKGTAKFVERTVLPANSIFEAALEEVAGAGAPATVISTDSRAVPGVSAVNFSIQFSDAQIRPGRRYAVRGRVLVNGQLLFATEQPIAVLASPQDRAVTITLIRPTLPPAPTAARTPPSRAPGNTADTAAPPPALRAAEQKSDPQASRKDVQARAQALAAGRAQVAVQVQAQTQVQAQADARAQTRLRAESQAQAQAAAQSEARALADAQAQAQAQAKAEAEARARSQVKAQTDAQAEAQVKAQAEAQAAEALAKAQAEAKAQTQAAAVHAPAPVALPAPALTAPAPLPAPAAVAAPAPAPRVASPESASRPAGQSAIWRGLYRFTADAATFEDCASGARLPIAQEGANVVLEQAYLRLFSAGGGNPGVLATVAGRVLPRAAPEGRPQRNTLVVDGFISLGGDACPPEVTKVAMSGRSNTSARPALENMRWKLEQLNQQPVEAIEKQREPHIILQSASRRVTGSGSCNQLLLGYALERSSLRFTEGVVTARTCDTGMRQERAFLAALATVTSYNMEARTLRLLDAQGRVIARFRAEEI